MIKEGRPTWINKAIFSRVILILLEIDEAAWDAAWAGIDNFDRLPKDIKHELLLKLSEMYEEARTAGLVNFNFEMLLKSLAKKAHVH